MKKFTALFIVLIMTSTFVGCQQPVEEKVDTIVLATTTSTYDSGLLDELLPVFEERYGIEVDVISVGTGQAIEMGKRGDSDIILVHARALEDQFVEEKHGTERFDVMYNDFVVLGPEGDPGEIYKSIDILEALGRIVNHIEDTNLLFASRGDNSGTHNKEINLWEMAGIERYGQEWYASLGQGMGDTLVATNEMNGYTLADRGAYLAMKDNLPNLEIVFEGDEELANPYGIIPVNPDKHDGVNYEEAMLLVEFFISAETQEMIGKFGKYTFGQPLFFPDA